MKLSTTLLLFLFLLYQSVFTQNVPEGYLLQYQQNFSTGKALGDFNVNNPGNWGIFKGGKNFYLQCTVADSVSRLPSNIAVLNNRIFGDFILEADVMPGLDSNGVREICLFLGIRDLTRYYYVQLASRRDSATHGIFLVKDNTKSKLTSNPEKPVTWNENKWHKVRLERNIIRRTIVVYLDDMTTPLMQIKDYELVMGSLGFGAFAATGRFDNIKIWAPTVISGEGQGSRD